MRIVLYYYGSRFHDEPCTCVVCGKLGWKNRTLSYEGNEVPMHEDCREKALNKDLTKEE